ncbi:MAG: thioredoxin-dependent thiol peroxidase [Candidatus Vogelbacteria bacterium CG10_big_fil_rev_8_21_14_0_10_45_14]|uniref:thioredoxin-dependent peroxiredoxin n=1 Tax=Candidatus Vogelbacteria bacterium CG10_big_fil_rev_8_21_14_0_10_45_14 TaxID=1975042 RepID=A0A2H0RKI0_9BACT|nr:MAG: thioredoxin-dependent thiol peroxidase [Candidatus Vogelbacteria bacterium CG10_big_fil_rev_8_21_14_0_10_45_14]
MLKVWKKAPLGVKVEGGKSLADHLGKWVVVYFYPKDDTPGCTVEAESFRDEHGKIKKSGAVVIGVSKDSERSHQKFIEKFGLPFGLWSDPEHKLMEAFGVWGERKFMGRSYMGTSRSTFIVNKDGKIAYVWEKVKPEGHAKEVLEKLKELS